MALGEAKPLMYANSMPKVVVTGANGFVGKHLIKELSDHGIEVVSVGGPRMAVNHSNPSGNTYSVDLNDANAVEAIDFSDVTGVIHLAGLASVGPSFDDPMRYITGNIGMECNLFEAALKQNTRPRFLIVSSGALYDTAATLPLTESSPTLPSSPYAVSKLGQEQLAQYYAGRGIEVIIARPFNHTGPGQGPGFIVPDIAQQVLACEQGTQDEVLVGNLDAKRDYTDVRDIARAYRLLLDKGVPGETYNICSGKALSGHDIVEGILKASGTKATITQDQDKMRPSDNPEIYGDHQKLTAATGWQPEIGTAKTLADVVADLRAQTNS
ncbi:MAG: NAD-dependent epimerase/dehydratase [Candidatus Saccharibacteria bacterium]|nr:NAD-dependent epimerase/dehydratase [Candidatus Saccharibacteria bacterium]